MLLREFLIRKLLEGGNLELDNPNDPAAPYRADEIDLKVHQRNFIVPILDKLLHDINDAFNAQYKEPIWSEQLLASKQFLGGSSLHFFDTKGIDDQRFQQLKPKVGDIDTQVNKELEDEIKAFLTANYHKKIGNATLLGYSAGNEQYNALFQFENPPMKIQIDFEFGRYSPETNTPDEWFRFSHSSDWADIEAGVKGVFHKYLYRALSGATSRQAYVAKMAGRGKARAIQISDEPETINTASFAVASKQGGGVSQKYVPYIDPTTNQPMVKNGLPVMQEVPSTERDYEQRLDKQFFTFFGRNPEPEDSKLQWSFVGTLDLINKYIDRAKKPKIVEDFLDICFEAGSQMITRDDPKRDAQTKFAAIDLMLEKLGLQSMRPKAIQMAKAYEDEFNEVEAYKKAHPEERQPRAALKKLKAAQGLTEAEEPAVKAQLRKGMPHLRDLKPADFLDLIDEMQAEGGRFKLQNIPLNVKIDGFGGRFGKNAEGQPFMATSRTEPRYKAGFVDYHKQKGTTDPEILGRAENFDKLFNEMMAAIKVVDGALGPDFLVNRQVTCEVLFLPFATQTEEGKLKFVGIEYDQLPAGVDLVIVPYRIVEASTGEDMPNGDRVVQKIAELGQSGSVSFMSNRLVQEDGLDVTEIINPLENIEELKNIISGVAGKRDRASLALRREVEEKLKPVQIALEKAIDEDPNIVGKDMLGQDYEGIVINSRLGPIKVTSQRQKDIITAKNAAKAAARAEQGRDNTTKTAVVAIGSFIGHMGHQELWNYTINKAQQLNGDPYLFIGNAEGRDDPIPPSVKVETWHKLYPQYADNISTVIEGGSLLQKIKHELINPLPGKLPRYENIIIMVGEDRKGLTMPQALMKAVNKFQGYENVKVSLEVTPRGTGMSGTALRNVLADPNKTPAQQLQVWQQAYNGGNFGAQKLPADWIVHLMDITRKGMGIQQPTAQPQPVAEVRLFNTLVRPTLTETARTSAAAKLSKAWDQQQQKSAASRDRAEKAKAEFEKEWKAKQEKEKGVEEGAPIVVAQAPIHIRNPKKAPQSYRNQGDIVPPTNPPSTEKRGVKGRPGQRPMPTSEGAAVEPDPKGYQKDLLTSPENSLVIDTPGDLDWYKLGQHYPTLGTDDPHEYGQGDSDMVVVPYSKKELSDLKQKLDRLKMRYKDIGGGHEQPEIHDKVEEKMLPKSVFAGTKVGQKVGSAGQWKNTGTSKNRPARAGDLVGDAAESIEFSESTMGNVLQWPEVVNKVSSAMKAMGWKGQRKDDGSFMFSTKGQLDDEWYIVVIDNRGNDMFTYALGTVEEGDPYIGEQMTLPNTEASVSELMNAIREGFGLSENLTQECAGSGVIANKKQAKDPRYSMSLTKDVRPGQIAKNLKAFSLEEDVETAMALAISKLIESQLK